MKASDIEVRFAPEVSALMDMKRFFYGALACLACASIPAVIVLMCAGIDADRVINGIPAQIDKQAELTRESLGAHVDGARDAALQAVDDQGNALRKSAIVEIHGARLDIKRAISAESGAVNEIAATAVLTANERAGDALTLANYHAKQFEDDADDIEKMIFEVVVPTVKVARQFDVALPGILKDEESIADNLSADIPKFTARTDSIEKHLDHIAAGIDALMPQKHKTPFWLRLLGFGSR